VTTGAGGAILTQDADLAIQARHLTTTAKRVHHWEFFHDEVGYNYRMPNLNAALGCAQLEMLPEYVERKRALAKRYEEVFADFPHGRIFREPEFSKSNAWLNVLVLNREETGLRDQILKEAHGQKMHLRPAWGLMHHMPMYKDCPRMTLNVSEDLERRMICLPSSVFLAESLTQDS